MEDAVRKLGPDHPLPAVLRKRQADKAAKESENKARSRRFTISLLLIVAGGLGLLFGGLGVTFGLLGTTQESAMQGWRKTSGRITRTWIDVQLWGSTNWHYPKISYTYTVAGKQYTASRLDRGSGLRFQHRKDAEQALTRFREQPAVTVHYDPANPASAVLNLKSGQRTNRENLYGGGAALLLGLVLLPLGILRLRRG